MEVIFFLDLVENETNGLGNEESNLRKYINSLKKLKILRFELWQFSKSKIKNEAMI